METVATEFEAEDDYTKDLWVNKKMIRYGGKRFPIDIEVLYSCLDSALSTHKRLLREEKEQKKARQTSQELQDEIIRELNLGTDEEIRNANREGRMTSQELHNEIVKDLDL